MRPPAAVLLALIIGVLQWHPSHGGERRDGTAPKPSFVCATAQTTLEHLICAELALATLDAEVAKAFHDYRDRSQNPTERDARLADQRAWLAGRQKACPVVAPPRPGAWLGDPGREVAITCLSSIYEQRMAVLRYARNAAAWPNIRFRPAIVEGAGTQLCDDLERDLLASFLGSGLRVNPLGEREIGFAPLPGLAGNKTVLRADIDAYNRGKPFPVLRWIEDGIDQQLPTVEYRAYDSPTDFLSAVGRGAEPLENSLRVTAHPVIDIAGLPHPGSKKGERQPRAAFARHATLTVDDMPRFFRYGEHVYLLAPMQPVQGKPGDLGIYRLYGPAQIHRVCLFDAHMPKAGFTDNALSLPEVATLKRAAAPLLPTGKLCASAGDDARMLADHAAWRPWVLDGRRLPGGLNGERLALYMRNRALTGPERARQYRAYVAARAAALEAVTPFYHDQFGRTPAEARRFAMLYLDRLISDGLEVDPDDESVAALFAADYADKHAAQEAALAGDAAGLRKALGPEPKAVAKGVKGDLDEPLVADALEHPEVLRELLETEFDPNETGASGRTPLMVAARLDLVAAARILLAHGASPDAGASEAVAQTDRAGDPRCMIGETAMTDTPGRTALSYAVEMGSPEMVRLLLDYGAVAAKPDTAGRRPVDYLKNRTGNRAQADEIAEMLK